MTETRAAYSANSVDVVQLTTADLAGMTNQQAFLLSGLLDDINGCLELRHLNREQVVQVLNRLVWMLEQGQPDTPQVRLE